VIVIVGHGPSILSGLGDLIDSHTVIRLKRGLLETYDRRHWGSRTDYLCARSFRFDHGHHPFWLFDSRKWCDYFAHFSGKKPTTGLCAVFCAIDRLAPNGIGLIGFDRVLRPDEISGRYLHDGRAEYACLHSLGVNIIDLVTYAQQIEKAGAADGRCCSQSEGRQTGGDPGGCGAGVQ
jgi:hypothetical protein